MPFRPFLVFALLALLVSPGCRTRKRAGPRQGSSPSVTSQQLGGLEVTTVSGLSHEETGAPLVIFLHGHGGGPREFVPAAQRFATRHSLRVLLPAAPLPLGDGHRWWSFDGSDWPGVAEGDDQPLEPVPQLVKVRAAMKAVLAEARARYAPRWILLGGFSQGGLLSMDLAVSEAAPVDQVAVLSGGLLAASIPGLRAPRDRKPPILIVHGRKDEVLSFAGVERHKTLLEKHGYAVNWRPFDGGHQWRAPAMFAELERVLPAGTVSERPASDLSPGETPPNR
jgi:phospholipase/carboxylesterase